MVQAKNVIVVNKQTGWPEGDASKYIDVLKCNPYIEIIGARLS